MCHEMSILGVRATLCEKCEAPIFVCGYRPSKSHCSAADAAGMADKIYQTSLAGLDKFSAEILEAEQQIQQEEAPTDL